MQYATQCLGVVNNVLNLHNLLLYMDRKIECFIEYLKIPLFSDHKEIETHRKQKIQRELGSWGE